MVGINSLNRLVIPTMGDGSSVLFVASTLAEKAVPGSYSYVLTKHAQVGMMRALCQDLAGTGIHTACICPGFTDTEMLRAHVPPEAMDAVRGMSAFNRLIDPGRNRRNPVLGGDGTRHQRRRRACESRADREVAGHIRPAERWQQ